MAHNSGKGSYSTMSSGGSSSAASKVCRVLLISLLLAVIAVSYYCWTVTVNNSMLLNRADRLSRELSMSRNEKLAAERNLEGCKIKVNQLQEMHSRISKELQDIRNSVTNLQQQVDVSRSSSASCHHKLELLDQRCKNDLDSASKEVQDCQQKLVVTKQSCLDAARKEQLRVLRAVQKVAGNDAVKKLERLGFDITGVYDSLGGPQTRLQLTGLLGGGVAGDGQNRLAQQFGQPQAGPQSEFRQQQQPGRQPGEPEQTLSQSGQKLGLPGLLDQNSVRQGLQEQKLGQPPQQPGQQPGQQLVRSTQSGQLGQQEQKPGQSGPLGQQEQRPRQPEQAVTQQEQRFRQQEQNPGQPPQQPGQQPGQQSVQPAQSGQPGQPGQQGQKPDQPPQQLGQQSSQQSRQPVQGPSQPGLERKLGQPGQQSDERNTDVKAVDEKQKNQTKEAEEEKAKFAAGGVIDVEDRNKRRLPDKNDAGDNDVTGRKIIAPQGQQQVTPPPSGTGPAAASSETKDQKNEPAAATSESAAAQSGSQPVKKETNMKSMRTN
jgi:hypothetical protein